MKSNLQLDTDELVHWFNALRNLPDDKRFRALDAFWSGQIDAKCWLVNTLNDYVDPKQSYNIYIFGGWLGILGNMLLQKASYSIGKIRSIDIDPECETFADTVNKIHEMNGWRFKAVTADMGEYYYQSDLYPDIVINTSTEHVSQEVYDSWWQKIPIGTLIVAQGNNYFSCGEHIRCSHTLGEFKIQNYVLNELYADEFKNTMYTRYMCMWYKQ